VKGSLSTARSAGRATTSVDASGVTSVEQLLRAALAAAPDLRSQALRVLEGLARVVDSMLGQNRTPRATSASGRWRGTSPYHRARSGGGIRLPTMLEGGADTG